MPLQEGVGVAHVLIVLVLRINVRRKGRDDHALPFAAVNERE